MKDDVISRQAAIDAVTDELDTIDHVPQWVFDRLEKRLKQLTPAQPEPCTGKWIPQDHNKRAGNISTCVYCYPICSKCGKVGIETYKYCPHCGAKMTEGDAE